MIQNQLRCTLGLALILVAVQANFLQSQIRADELERELLRHAPKVMQYLREKDYTYVGILKFRVKKGQEPLTDNAGTLNRTVANRLELALVLANDFKKPIHFIQEASEIASRTTGANHLTAEGRRKLFQARYPLAWSQDHASPDAFLTGVVTISPDLHRLTVGILAFDRNSSTLQPVDQFTADNNPAILGETGESFLLRGAFDNGKIGEVTVQATDKAVRVREQQQKHPLFDAAAPVSLEIFYDDKRVPLELRDGKCFVSEPMAAQKVRLVLRRNDPGPSRYGVVLKVNGINTARKERLPDLQCLRWLLDPTSSSVSVEGFQVTKGRREAFKVLSPEESKLNEMNYGADVGTISLVVFRESKIKEKSPSLLSDEQEDVAALTRAVYPAEKPRNLSVLKQQLRDASAKPTTRGLIVGGNLAANETVEEDFKPEPIPVMSATIIYYRPQNQKQ